MSSIIYYLHFDEVRRDHTALNTSYNWINTFFFTAGLFYFQASEGGKIGPYAQTPFSFLNLTEIFYIGKIFKSRKQKLNLAVSRMYMPKNCYAINYAILAKGPVLRSL